VTKLYGSRAGGFGIVGALSWLDSGLNSEVRARVCHINLCGPHRPWNAEVWPCRKPGFPRHTGGAGLSICRHCGGGFSAFSGHILLYVPVEDPVVGTRLFVDLWRT
jgi:hypothetical protein